MLTRVLHRSLPVLAALLLAVFTPTTHAQSTGPAPGESLLDYLENLTDINAPAFEQGLNTLHYAATQSSGAIALFALISRDADVDAQVAKTGQTALLIAALENHTAMVRLLLEAGADPDVADAHGMTPLIAAALRDNSTAIEMLLRVEAGLDAVWEAPDNPGGTALHLALHKGNLDVVRRLLEAGANPNLLDEQDQSPLAVAVRIQSPEAVTALLDAGAAARGDALALRYAVEATNLALVEPLLAAGADLEAQREALFVLAFERDWEAGILRLLETGAALPEVFGSAADAPGLVPVQNRPPLAVAAERGYLEVVRTLVLDDVDLSPLDPTTNATPLALAETNGHDEVARLLRAAGAR